MVCLLQSEIRKKVTSQSKGRVADTLTDMIQSHRLMIDIIIIHASPCIHIHDVLFLLIYMLSS